MKKWMMISLMLIIVSVGGWFTYYDSPEVLVKAGIEIAQNDDYALILENENIELSDDEKVIVHELLESATYEVKDMKTIEDEAKVPVEVTLVDVTKLVFNEGGSILKNTISDWRHTLNDLFKNRLTELATRQLALVLEETSQKPMKSLTIEIPFKQYLLGWKLDITEEWIESVIKDYLI